MDTLARTFIIVLVTAHSSMASHEMEVSSLLDRYTATADQLGSYCIEYTCNKEMPEVTDSNRVAVTHHICVMASEGDRAYCREQRWGGVPDAPTFLPEDNGHYRSREEWGQPLRYKIGVAAAAMTG